VRHPSAEKRHRQSLKRRERNRAARSALRTAIREAREAIAKKDKGAMGVKVKAAESAIRNAASRGIIRKNTASRVVGRIAKAAWRAYRRARNRPYDARTP
jgi:small subunit ribosomal protein S20